MLFLNQHFIISYSRPVSSRTLYYLERPLVHHLPSSLCCIVAWTEEAILPSLPSVFLLRVLFPAQRYRSLRSRSQKVGASDLGSWPGQGAIIRHPLQTFPRPRVLPAPSHRLFEKAQRLSNLSTTAASSYTIHHLIMTRNSFHSKSLSSPLGSIDEEGDSILDESILDDSQSMDMAAPRFDAPQQQAYSSPQFLSEDAWHFSSSHDAASFQPVNSQPATTFLQSFQPHNQPGSLPHYSTFAEHHPAPWQPINMDTKSHVTLSDEINAHYDLKTEESQHTPAMPPPAVTGAEHYTFTPSMTSPQSENGWGSASSSSETKKTPKREAINRQSFSTFPQHLRREGIRKKNARVEIPEGRTIDTIEEEIRLCDPNDEAKLKELKQFKRLLRNREAA